MVISLSQTTKPKSDQLNAEDFLVSDKTLIVTGFSFNGSEDQPFSIYTDYDDKKPYKPNKSMRKILNAAWGEASGDVGVIYSDWNGRQINLYRDPDVLWAGKKEGGIVIGAMSHISSEMKVKLQVKRGQKKEYTIKSIKVSGVSQPAQNQPQPSNAKADWAKRMVASRNYGSIELQKVWAEVPLELKPEMQQFYEAKLAEAIQIDDASHPQNIPPPDNAPPNLENASIDDF